MLNEESTSTDPVGVSTVTAEPDVFDEASSAALPLPELPPSPIPDLPLQPLPWRLTVSGLYRASQGILQPLPLRASVEQPEDAFGDDPAALDGNGADAARTPIPVDIRPLPWLVTEDLRLDVDGRYPQMIASGTVRSWLTGQLHWIANVTRTARNTYQGAIFYKSGDTNLLPHTHVRVVGAPSLFPHQQKLAATFTGGAATRQRSYSYISRHFHKVEFEFDCVQGTQTITTVPTHGHPNRPATLPNETLPIETVFTRAGFDVSKSGGDSVVPSSAAGANQTWSNQEMHDAMQVHWSRFANKPQWALWTLWAGRHDMGPGLGGIMFDSIGANHRQGTALFLDSFISNAPTGDPNPAGWVRRMRFWTAVHEMGHAFNLAHSWQKSLGTPWIPLANEPEARSFMNYPYNVAGGQQAFFSDFDYRFSDSELLFMRHAPERFVQMGNADWFDHHGFEQAATRIGSGLSLELRVHRDRPEFAFLEPLNLELKLENVGGVPVIIDASRLRSLDSVTVVTKRERDPARVFLPFARLCLEPDLAVLHPGESLYAPVEPSAGVEGWDVSEPGRYLVQVALHLDDRDVVSNPLTVRVAPPRSYDEQYVAQDYFTDAVGRILAFDGSRVLDEGNAVLEEVRERIPQSAAARHATYALAAPLLRAGKVLTIPEDAVGTSLGEVGAEFGESTADEDTARRLLDEVLVEDPDGAAHAFGHMRFKEHADEYAQALAEAGDTRHAGEVQEALHTCLARRHVLPAVLDEIETHQQSLEHGEIPTDWHPRD